MEKIDSLPLGWHFSEKGLSNEVVRDLMRLAGVTSSPPGGGFRGIVPYDRLFSEGEDDVAIPRRNFSIIVNVGMHFVTLFSEGDLVYYVDSLGLPVWREELKNFILERFPHKRRYCYNPRQIQDWNSSHCGLYAALFTVYLEKYCRGRRRGGTRPRLKFHRRKKLLPLNDALCVKYIKNMCK